MTFEGLVVEPENTPPELSDGITDQQLEQVAGDAFGNGDPEIPYRFSSSFPQ
jgi:hypothetical protein